MRHLFTYMSLFAIAGTAQAQSAEILVESRQEPGVSEVKVALQGRPFAFERVGPRQIDLVTPEAGNVFDTRLVAVAEKSPHIESARQVGDSSSSRLRLVLKCDCDFDMGMQGDSITLRILDPLGSEIDTASLPDPTSPEKQKAIRGSGSPHAPFSSPRPVARVARNNSLEAISNSADNGNTVPSSSIPADDEVRFAREHLMEQLARAADQGLLEFASDRSADLFPEPPEDAAVNSFSEAETASEDDGEEEASLPIASEDQEETNSADMVEAQPVLQTTLEIPVRAKTAKDRDFQPGRTDTLVAVAPCLEPNELRLSDWTDERDFLDAVAAYRAALLDQFDEPRADAVAGLTRLYIVNGFGAEAAQLLKLYGDTVEDSDLLKDLARIVDGERPSPRGPIATSAPCSGPALMWRRIAGLGEIGPPDPMVGDEALVDAFANQPVSVRSLVGPALISNLVDRNELEAAQRINLIMSRVPESNADALDFARAKLLESTGEPEAAEALFRRLAQRDSLETQQALVKLVDSLIRRSASVPQELTDSLSAAARLARGSAMETQLIVSETRARAFSEGLNSALIGARNAMERTPSQRPVFEDAIHSVLEGMTAGATGPVEYSRAILENSDLISPSSAGDVARRHVASELTKIGLANAALDILEPTMSRRTPATRRVAAAALLHLGRPEDVIIALEGLSDDESLRLTAEAYEQLSKFDDALKTSDQLEVPSDRPNQALRAGDWAGAAETDDANRRLLAAYMASQDSPTELSPSELERQSEEAQAYLAPPQVGVEVTLDDARKLMEASRSVRSTIEEVLDDG